MLIRLVINNFLSFGEEREFNMLPNERYAKLPDHKYKAGPISVLKLAAIYGANAAGKSNMVKALGLITHLVHTESVPPRIGGWHFRLDKINRQKPTTIAVEFQAQTKAYIYAVQIVGTTLIAEELYTSGLGLKEDELVFERTVHKSQVKIRFNDIFYQEEKNKVLQGLLEDSLLVPDKPAIKYLTTLKVPQLGIIQEALDWLTQSLKVIGPDDPARALAYFMGKDETLLTYANKMIQAYSLGIDGIHITKTSLQDFFGRDSVKQIDEIKNHLSRAGTGMITMTNAGGNEYTIVKEGEDIFVQQLQTVHLGGAGLKEIFSLDHESDGSRRLLDFIPVFQEVVLKPVVYVIDEIERSLHPAIIKELITKFSEDSETQGQLIFTTHESNLLDQALLRRDEIWFAEKDSFGSTDLYSLSKFKEHHTIDIQKGYLNGRYGGIPFIGNLEQLNWHEHDLV